MARKYRLRLRDGTLLVVDYAGLRTWLLDDQAMVQPAGSRGWKRLAPFLAEAPPDAPAPIPARESATVPPTTAEKWPVGPAEIEPAEPSAIALVPLAEAVLPRSPTAARAARPSSPQPLDLAEVARSAMTAPVAEPGRAPSVAAMPIIPLKPLELDDDEWEDELEELDLVDDEGPRIQAPKARTPGVASPVPGWLRRAKDALTARLDPVLAYLRRLTQGEPTKPPPPPRAAHPPRRQAVQPPSPISELPVLRLAPLKEDPKGGDVYGGPVGVRSRAGRTVVVVGLGVVGGAVVVAWSWWLSRPTTPDAGKAGSDARVVLPSPPPAEPVRVVSPRDVQAVSARLPHLPPETIALVMSSAGLGAPDPVQVFRRAQEALNRGRPALKGYDAQELWRLEQAAMAALRPADQQRVRAYERARSAHDVASAEDAKVLALVARATRALPPQNRSRYRALLGKAVAAGLAPPGPPTGGSR
jgi:hypothetical protein